MPRVSLFSLSEACLTACLVVALFFATPVSASVFNLPSDTLPEVLPADAVINIYAEGNMPDVGPLGHIKRVNLIGGSLSLSNNMSWSYDELGVYSGQIILPLNGAPDELVVRQSGRFELWGGELIDNVDGGLLLVDSIVDYHARLSKSLVNVQGGTVNVYGKSEPNLRSFPFADEVIILGGSTQSAPSKNLGEGLTFMYDGYLGNAYDTNLTIYDGILGDYSVDGPALEQSFLTMYGGEVRGDVIMAFQHIADLYGGVIDGEMRATAGSIVNIRGGTVAGNITASEFSEVNVYVTHAEIDGVPIDLMSNPVTTLSVDDGDMLNAILSDDSIFDFALSDDYSESTDMLLTSNFRVINGAFNADTNGDGSIDVFDIDTSEDHDSYIAFMGYERGDVDVSGEVDLIDLSFLASSFGRSVGVRWIDGDFNNDGVVDLADLPILATNFNTTPMPVPSPAPAPLLVAIWAMSGVSKRSRANR
ncbi:hypothetical protein [Mucisphaera sp.]|uniref:hypothetical protein n=1 Tax=Mucisphaera sp. TaxID=2913024 RepID=UPI003D108462